MAKFLKSIFHGEKRRPSKPECAVPEEPPPLDDRRKLSISRSGRMRQANKHRRSLTPQLYGENYQAHEKATSKEYHVNKPIQPVEPKQDIKKNDATKPESRRNSVKVKTPEEEIDSAFEIIDKS